MRHTIYISTTSREYLWELRRKNRAYQKLMKDQHSAIHRLLVDPEENPKVKKALCEPITQMRTRMGILR
jgi:hypothetical protein